MPQRFPVHFLRAEGERSGTHKFYIIVEADDKSFALHDTDTDGRSGRIAELANAADAQSRLQKKLREYKVVRPDIINSSARDKVVTELRRRFPQLETVDVDVRDNEIVFDAFARSSRKPKIRTSKMNLQNIWI